MWIRGNGLPFKLRVVYHPQTDGISERTNQTVEIIIQSKYQLRINFSIFANAIQSFAQSNYRFVKQWI